MLSDDKLRPPTYLEEAAMSKPELAFITNTAELYNHYSGVWKLLPAGSFEVIAGGIEESPEGICDFIRAKGYPCSTLSETLAAGKRYRNLVSHHPFISNDLPGLHVLADRQIRFMYGLGKAGWNFGAWNQDYDAILCFGPHQRAELEKVTRATLVEMGYPRFDSFFDGSFSRKDTLARYNCDPTRKTIVWLPTWSDLASIGQYQECVAMLGLRFNVIVKLHPFMRHQCPAEAEAVKALPFNAVIDEPIDNVALYQAADFIFADYGGPMFGALYTDCNLLLLNLPGANNHHFLGANSPDMLIRKLIPNVSTPDQNAIWNMLRNDALWEEQKRIRAELRRWLFAPYFGFSAQVAANCLANIDTILDLQGKGK
jgi:hypothetical protein